MLKLPLSKKSDSGPALAPSWHPNFRNFERLPDTKVVRTAFFVNAAAISLAVILLGYVGWREFQVNGLRQQVAAAEAEIQKNQKQNAEGLRLTKLFTDEEKKVLEAANFARVPMSPTALMQALAATLPKEIQLDAVDVRYNDNAGNRVCILRGVAAGSKDEASGAASAYVETLKTAPQFVDVFESVNLTTITADARGGFLGFEVLMRFKSEGKKS